MANFPVCYSCGAQGLPPAVAELQLAPVCGPLGWNLLTSGVPPAEPSGGSSWEHGPSLLHTMHLTLTCLIF